MEGGLNLDSATMQELHEIVMRTPEGSTVNTEALKRIAAKAQSSTVVTTTPVPKTFTQARAQAKEFLTANSNLPEVAGAGFREPGRAIIANEAQPVSRP